MPTPEKQPERNQDILASFEMVKQSLGSTEEVELTSQETEELKEMIREAKEYERKGKAGDIESLKQAIEEYRKVKERFNEMRREKGGLPQEEETQTPEVGEIDEKTRELMERLNIQEQYNQNIETLKETGLVYELESGEVGIKAIDGKEYSLPTLQEVVQRIQEQQEKLETKEQQGFTQILITPFGSSIKEITNKVQELILSKHQEGNLKDTNGEELELDEDNPIYFSSDAYGNNVDTDISGKLLYQQESFDDEGKGQGGKTKQEILEEQSLGFSIKLIQDRTDLSELQEQGGRVDIPAGTTPQEILKQLQEQEANQHESGLTPEEWLTYFTRHLQETNTVIDDINTNKANWSVGTYAKDTRWVPVSYWSRSSLKLHLNAVTSGSDDSDGGFQSSVSI